MHIGDNFNSGSEIKMVKNLCVDMDMHILEVQIGITNSPVLAMHREKVRLDSFVKFLHVCY